MAYGDFERMRQADKRAVVQAARRLLDGVERQLRDSRLQRRVLPPIVSKDGTPLYRSQRA